jgi:hypothetical protein
MAKIQLSQRFQLITPDIQKILIGAGMAAIGAFVTFLAENVGHVDFGQWTPFVVMAVSILANIIRKWLSETKY